MRVLEGLGEAYSLGWWGGEIARPFPTAMISSQTWGRRKILDLYFTKRRFDRITNSGVKFGLPSASVKMIASGPWGHLSPVFLSSF